MTTRQIYEGTNDEAFTATIKSSSTLFDDLDVDLSFDGTTWIVATWQGTEGTTRKATITLTPANTPAPLVPEEPIDVYFRIGGDVIGRCEDQAVVHAL